MGPGREETGERLGARGSQTVVLVTTGPSLPVRDVCGTEQRGICRRHQIHPHRHLEILLCPPPLFLVHSSVATGQSLGYISEMGSWRAIRTIPTTIQA